MRTEEVVGLPCYPLTNCARLCAASQLTHTRPLCYLPCPAHPPSPPPPPACRWLLQRVADDLGGAARDSTKATDRLLWAVNTFGESLAEVVPLSVVCTAR